jgi:hypothetical protein
MEEKQDNNNKAQKRATTESGQLDWDLNPRRTTTLGLNNCQLE